MKKSIVVIGSNSFSGSHFVNYCLEQGWDVTGISRSAELATCFLPYKWETKGQRGHFKFEQLDLNLHTSEIIEVIKRESAPIVVNFAAQGMVAQSWETPEDWYQTNVVANVRLHDQLRKLPFLVKYVHISTPEVYGNCEGVITEKAPFNPSTPYAASRAACDLHLRTFFQRYKFPYCYTRAANVFGAGQQLYRIIPRTVLYARLGKKMQLHGGGHSVRAFIHINDVSDAVLKIALNGAIGEGYHISTDRFISIRELVEMIAKKMGVEPKNLIEVVDERPGKDAAYLLDSTKLSTQLGWKATVSLEQGIDETITWVDKFLPDLKNQPFDYIHKK